MIDIIIISVLSVLVVILGYTTFNLLRKNEKAEDIINSYYDFFNTFSTLRNWTFNWTFSP